MSSNEIFPSIVPENAQDNGDDVYTKEELDGFEYQELRQMAMEAETDAINGKSTKMEIISYFLGQSTLEGW